MKKKLSLISIVFLLSSCSYNRFQSAWHPVSSAAKEIKNLTWGLSLMSIIVFLVVCILLTLALINWKKVSNLRPINKFILILGFFVPTIILSIMLVYSLKSTVVIRENNRPHENEVNIKVIGHQWWWEVHYPDSQITTANEIHIPAGVPIKFELIAKDVIHSFWIPNVQGKMDMIPGQVNYLGLKVDHPGEYRGVCAEFCGLQHALMAFPLVVMKKHDFEQWILNQQKPSETTFSKKHQRGKEVYFEAACNSCHRITGTEAEGKAGPDLSHIASRLTLGAGTVPNNREYLAQWIVDPQLIKPANRMPPTQISGDDLEALLDYLETLK